MRKFLKTLFLLFIGLFSFVSCSNERKKGALITVKVPLVEADEALFLAGNFNGWNPADSNYMLQRENDSTFTFRWKKSAEKAEFKITRGSWSNVELSAEGDDIANRVIDASTTFPLEVEVESWDRIEKPSTASENVSVLSEEFNISTLGKIRKVWIYLPASYQKSPDRSYPVLYMHDGQNLFDQKTAPFGEWEIDETLDQFSAEYPEKEVIVVGINHGEDDRIAEYTPFANAKYGGGKGKEYIDFLAKELKPFVDKNYRTLPGASHTGIGGSSLGGLISFHAVLVYPEVFGKGLIFSPSFWFSEQNFEFASANLPKASKAAFYFYMGEKEGPSGKPYLDKMVEVLEQKNFPKENYRVSINPNGEHNESAWREEFPEAYKWLYVN